MLYKICEPLVQDFFALSALAVVCTHDLGAVVSCILPGPPLMELYSFCIYFVQNEAALSHPQHRCHTAVGGDIVSPLWCNEQSHLTHLNIIFFIVCFHVTILFMAGVSILGAGTCLAKPVLKCSLVKETIQGQVVNFLASVFL